MSGFSLQFFGNGFRRSAALKWQILKTSIMEIYYESPYSVENQDIDSLKCLKALQSNRL